MEWEEFKTNCEVLSLDESALLRTCFIDEFVDTTYEGYKKHILTREDYIDGRCYTGYLWDYLKEKSVVKENYIERLVDVAKYIYVMWDVHTCERIYIKNYWKFGKENIVKINIEMFLKGEEFFPEDIYLFDDTLSWYFIKTHEYTQGKKEKRYCLKGGL